MSSPGDDVAKPYTTYGWARAYGAPSAVSFFPDGQRIATTGHIDFSVRIWDIETGEEASEPLAGHHTHMPMCISVSKRGDDMLIVTGGADNQVLLWTWNGPIDHLAPRILFKGPNQFDVLSVAFSSLRSPLFVASSGTDGIVQLWKTNLSAADASSEPSLKIPFPNTQISSIQFSPTDSSVLAVACLDKTLHIMDAHSGERKAKFSSYTTFISSLAWFPGGKRGAFSEDCGIHTFTYTSNLNGAGRAKALPQVNGSGRRSLSYGSVSNGMNGHYPLGGNGKELNDLGQGKGAIIESDDPFIGHKRAINSISISPDGRFMASGSNDKTIRIWNFTSRKQVGKPIKLDTYVRIVQWYPYSQESSSDPEQQTLKLLSVTENGEIRLWDMSYLETEESVEVTKRVSFEIRSLLQKVRVEFQETLEYEVHFHSSHLSHCSALIARYDSCRKSVNLMREKCRACAICLTPIVLTANLVSLKSRKLSQECTTLTKKQ